MKKVKDWICKTFGHSFDNVEEVMFRIQIDAINAKNLKPELKCKRCKAIFVALAKKEKP